MATSKTSYGQIVAVSIALFLYVMSSTGCNKKQEEMRLKKIELNRDMSLYPEAGFLKGVSGAFGGSVGDWIVYGGGCNFPGVDPLEGGAKVYYSSFYAFREDDQGQTETKLIGDLAEPLGYGASVLSRDGLLYLLGGTNGKEPTKHIHIVDADTEGFPQLRQVEQELPIAWFEGAAAYCGDSLYLIGGWQGLGEPNNTVWEINLKSGSSQAIAELPDGARIQPIAFVADGSLYLFGGYRPSRGEGDLPYMHQSGYRLSLSATSEGWQEVMVQPRLSDDDRKLLFVGSTATYDPQEERVYVVGGVDWDIFATAVQREYDQAIANATGDEEALERFAKARVDYMTMASEAYNFMPRIITYDTDRAEWRSVAQEPAFATAGAVLVRAGNALYVIGGERKPGVRTFDAWRWK